MRLFQRLQFAEQAVVFGVGHGRRVQHVVFMAVTVQQLAQLGCAQFMCGHRKLSNGKRAGMAGPGYRQIIVQANKRSAATLPGAMPRSSMLP